MEHWQTLTFMAGFRQTGIVAPILIKGAMNGEACLAYIKRCLTTHSAQEGHRLRQRPLPKVAGVEEAIEARGEELRCLPKYSPDLIQLNCYSIPSRHCCARRPSAHSMGCSDALAPSFEDSSLPNAQAILGTPAMIHNDRDMLGVLA